MQKSAGHEVFAPNHRRNVKWTEINLKILFLLLPFENMKFLQNFLAEAGGEMTGICTALKKILNKILSHTHFKVAISWF